MKQRAFIILAASLLWGCSTQTEMPVGDNGANNVTQNVDNSKKDLKHETSRGFKKSLDLENNNATPPSESKAFSELQYLDPSLIPLEPEIDLTPREDDIIYEVKKNGARFLLRTIQRQDWASVVAFRLDDESNEEYFNIRTDRAGEHNIIIKDFDYDGYKDILVATERSSKDFIYYQAYVWKEDDFIKIKNFAEAGCNPKFDDDTKTVQLFEYKCPDQNDKACKKVYTYKIEDATLKRVPEITK